MTHDLDHPHHGRGPVAALASAWNTLCCLPATQPWLWLVRSGAVETAPPIGLVLLDVLPRLLDAFGAGHSAMVDLTEEERAAIAATMKRVALLMDEIGWATPLAGLTEAQVRALIEESVEGFREAMSDIAKANAPEVPFLTLDYNRRPSFADRVNDAVDCALTGDQATRTPRDYLGGSRLGHDCERALQFEFTGTPKDEGQDFSGQSLRIFAIGHALEDLAVAWLRGAGFDLYTRKGNRPDGGQFGFSVAGGRIRGHVDGIIAAGPVGFDLAVPALWECKTMNAKNWRACVKDGVTKSKPVYAAQIAVYQAYMEASVPGISAAPAVFTAINKDTAEMHHEQVPFDADLAQRMSDRGVRILQATDAGELLPRIAASADFFECRFCPWAARCWRLER